MDTGKTFYATDVKQWRAWLEKNHSKEPEIWFTYYTRDSGKPFISYSDALDEALCFGWIDSIVKKLDEHGRAQRFTPRTAKSSWSETNKERVRRLIKAGKMAPAGLAVTPNLNTKFEIPADIIKKLKADLEIWENFQNFPEGYKRIRIGWIDSARNRPESFKQRLEYFLKMTKQGKRFGMVQ